VGGGDQGPAGLSNVRAPREKRCELVAPPPLNLRATGEGRRDGLYQDDLQRKVTSTAL